MSKNEHLTKCLKADILLDGINIKTVQEFKYLDSIIHYDGSCQKDVKKGIGE